MDTPRQEHEPTLSRPHRPARSIGPRPLVSKSQVRAQFRAWQVIAGFDRPYPFHALRHTAVTSSYRASRDLFLAQRFARHAGPLTTIVYTHPSDEELREGVRGLRC